MLTDYAQKLLDRKAAAAPSKSGSSSAARTASPAPAPASVPIPAALAVFGPWMRVKDVASYLGVSVSQVSSYRDTGALEFCNISTGQADGVGADWRISRDSVAAFEQSRQTKPVQ